MEDERSQRDTVEERRWRLMERRRLSERGSREGESASE
jgi:hypothetical protein